MTLFQKLAALVCAALAVTAPATAQDSKSAPGVSASQIKIGMHLSMSGPASFVGQGLKVGIDLAVAEINANGGVNGRKLAYVFVDDRGAPDGGVAAARRLVESEEVFLVHGGGTSTSTVATLPYFARSPVPYYISLASDPVITQQFYKNIYSGATISQATLAVFITDFVAGKLKAKTVAMLQCDQGHCIAGAPRLKGLLERKGLAVSVVTFNSGETDFTGQVYEVKNLKPDVVFIYGLASDTGRLLPQIRRAGIEAEIVTEIASADPSVSRVAGRSAEGFYSFWVGGKQVIDDRTGPMANWLNSLDTHKIERPANTPNLNSMMGYADVYVLAEAMRLAGTDLTRDNVINNLDTKIKNFVAGENPPWTFASAIGLPRTFSSTDHQGNKSAQIVVSRSGMLKPVKD